MHISANNIPITTILIPLEYMITIYINLSKYQKNISKCIRYLCSSRALQMHPLHNFPQENLDSSCSHSLHLFPQGVKGEAEQVNASVKCLQISLFRFTQTIPKNQKQNRRKCWAAEIFSLFNFMQIFFLKINVCAGKSKKKFSRNGGTGKWKQAGIRKKPSPFLQFICFLFLPQNFSVGVAEYSLQQLNLSVGFKDIWNTLELCLFLRQVVAAAGRNN